MDEGDTGIDPEIHKRNVEILHRAGLPDSEQPQAVLRQINCNGLLYAHGTHLGGLIKAPPKRGCFISEPIT